MDEFGVFVGYLCRYLENVFVEKRLEELRARGRRPYYIYGDKFGRGNEGTAAAAYAEAYREIQDFEADQGREFDYIFCPSGTGATQSGLICGHLLAGDGKKIMGIIISSRETERARPVMSEGVSDYFVKNGRPLPTGWAEEIILLDGYRQAGYGHYDSRITSTIREQYRRKGAKEECLRIVDECYAQRREKGFVKIKYDLNLGKANMEYRMANGMQEMMDAVKRAGGGPADFGYANESFVYSWSDPQDLIDNIEYIFHTHAKCYNIHEDYTETATDIAGVVDAYKKAGYTGFLSTEYEGGEHLRDDLPVDSVEQVRRHQEALRRAIEG